MELSPCITVPRTLAFACAAVLLLAGSAVTSVIPVQAGEVLIAGNHGNNSNKHKHEDKNKNKGNKHQGDKCEKSDDKSKCNNGVRDHGKGEGREGAGQGKGLGHQNKK